MRLHDTAEYRRLEDNKGEPPKWWRWGPYVSERAWGTVREDYSADGDAWRYLTHDLARSKAYRWGEDGLAAWCDRYQVLVFALALWNGRDPILKERAFGLTPWEGNHGEDVKEYYFYEDNTPTHSYASYLYKYPQARFPYEELTARNAARGGDEPEYELLDTGIFDDLRYFDVRVEYAKVSPEDIAVRITIFNRGPETATLHVLPQLWYRNTWAWREPRGAAPAISLHDGGDALCLCADSRAVDPLPGLITPYALGTRYLYAEAGGTPLFTDNETNRARMYGERDDASHPKDAFHRHIIHGEDCCNPARRGSKAGIHYVMGVGAEASVSLHLRLTDTPTPTPLDELAPLFARRRAEADAFYAALHPPGASAEEKDVQRRAWAGLLWSKQVYLFDVRRWLDGDFPSAPPSAARKQRRNRHWRHLNSMRVLSMPDKWEYPWFAAWDLAFIALPLALVDPAYAKEQLWLMLFEQFQHPNGQIPAYEWEFSEVNPPVHAWAVWRVYNMEKHRHGRADRAFLERCFHKLLINFAWWVNKVDRHGNNVFEGGFLGLDNIAVFDRSEPLPGGAVLEQCDATGWMAMYCLNMMRIALELALENKSYEGLATKFFEHFVYIGAAMQHMGDRDYQLWDEEDGFFYDVLREGDGRYTKFRVRSLVGLIPLFAVERLEEDWLAPFPSFRQNLRWFLENRSQFARFCCYPVQRGGKTTYLLSLVDPTQMRRVLERVFDPAEFLSPYGVRSLSKAHRDRPFHFNHHSVSYEPGEARSKIKGGNSNWRGPVWLPANFLLIEALRKLHKGLGDDYRITVTAGADILPASLSLREAAALLAERLIALFTRDHNGRRPCDGTHPIWHDGWHEQLLFYEFFHGDHGRGLGASHQTGWTALIACLVDEWRRD